MTVKWIRSQGGLRQTQEGKGYTKCYYIWVENVKFRGRESIDSSLMWCHTLLISAEQG